MTTNLSAVPSQLLVDFDIYDPAIAGSVDRVQEELAKMAALGPVVYSTAHGGHWIVTGYSEVQDALRDSERFSSYPNNIMPHGGERTLPLELDPPDHGVFRHALQPLFSPRRMQALEPEIRSVVNELIDGFATRGHAEFVEEFAHELPTTVFLQLLDLPVADAPLFTDATQKFMLGDPTLSEAESNAVRENALVTMSEYFAAVVEDRRHRDPGSDILSTVIHTEVVLDDQSRRFTDAELQNMFFLLLIAGLHTVQGSLGWAVVHLSGDEEQRAALASDPSRIPGAVEEILRIEGAVSPGRRVLHDTDLGGVRLRAGDQLLLSLAAANRDAAEFGDSGVVRVDRSPNRHLSFGAGAHRCLGSHLARVELRIALEALCRRIPDFRVDPIGTSLWHASQVRGVLALPIVFTPERAAD